VSGVSKAVKGKGGRIQTKESGGDPSLWVETGASPARDVTFSTQTFPRNGTDIPPREESFRLKNNGRGRKFDIKL